MVINRLPPIVVVNPNDNSVMGGVGPVRERSQTTFTKQGR